MSFNETRSGVCQIHLLAEKLASDTLVMTDDATVPPLRMVLVDEKAALPQRFRALFSLKHIASLSPATSNTIPAIHAMAAGLNSPSALLKHEVAYCLGQSGKSEAVPFLREVLEDRGGDAMCRHEAAEALGALCDDGSLELLRQKRDDEREEEVVRETCDLAIGRIEWMLSKEAKEETLKKR